MQSDEAVQSLFDRVVALSAQEREAVLTQHDHDPAVVARVRDLLLRDEKASGFLGASASQDFGHLASMIGRKIHEFTIQRLLGHGGMGTVYLAHDDLLRRSVALKFLPEFLQFGPALERFQQGARAAARLNHPGIVAVYRFEADAQQPFIVMEYVDGETLANVLKRSRQSDGVDSRAKLLDIVLQVAEALDYAHRQRVIHRDTKPSNILVNVQGHAKVTDFGIAKILSEDPATAQSAAVGTCYYMSPEQASLASVSVDERTDVFSLGVILYEALANQRPFDGQTDQQVIQAVLHRDPTPLRKLAPNISKDLATVCQRALEKRPEDRFPSMAHLAAELRSCIRGEPIISRPPSAWRRTKRWVRVHRTGVLAGSAALAVLVAASLGLIARQAHLASLGTLVVRAELTQSGSVRAVALRWDPSGSNLSPEMELGSLPIRVRLAPGWYRVRLYSGATLLADFDDVIVAGSEVTRDVGEANGDSTTMVTFNASDFEWTVRNPMTGATEHQSFALPAFSIDAAEVSNADYQAFVTATGHPVPATWPDAGPDPALADLPVTGVTHSDALAYSLWRGKRLPTLDEWMAAGQFPDSRVYPWGADPVPQAAIPTEETIRSAQDRTQAGIIRGYAMGAHAVLSDPQCATPAGLFHMFGNVREYTGTPIFLAGLGGNGAATVVVVGADWTLDPNYTDLSATTLQPIESGSPRIGFRCAKTVSGSIPQIKGATP